MFNSIRKYCLWDTPRNYSSYIRKSQISEDFICELLIGTGLGVFYDLNFVFPKKLC